MDRRPREERIMASTAPKTNFIAGDGLTYTQLNALEENVRMLQGGDATLPLSTDAATGKALAKRDADGDIAFRDIVARYVSATGLYMAGVAAGEYIIPGFDSASGGSNSTTYVKVAEYKCPCSGVLRVLLGLRLAVAYGTAYCRIYKNGVAYGIERSTTLASITRYNEDLAFTYGDLVQVYVKSSDGSLYTAIVDPFAIKYDGPGQLSLY